MSSAPSKLRTQGNQRPRGAQRPRRALLGAAVLFCVLFAASCRAVLGTDDYQSSATVLCKLLDQCYATGSIGDCEKHIEEGLTSAPSGLPNQWLTAFSDQSCIEGCTSARRCLDAVPVCVIQGCKVREDCCGFLEGRRDCDEITGACCAREGIACESTAECCSDAGECSPLTKTCGGVQCLPPGAPCKDFFECCTQVCRDSVCAETICAPNGFECAADLDCCDGSCGPDRKCGEPACAIEAAPCSPDGLPCCGALECTAKVTGEMGVCVATQCFGIGVDCLSNDQCCSGRCDPTFHRCESECIEDGQACIESLPCCNGACSEGTCGCSNTTCTIDADCCTGKCLGDICAPACNPQTCDHDECVTGAPLKPNCKLCSSGSCTFNDTCLQEVCTNDPYCCCSGWDSLCANAALLCGGSEVCD